MWLTHDQSENAQISAFHSSPDTSLLILSPRSTHIFDRYAHPAWLPPRLRAKVQSERAKAGEEGDNDEWKTKVLLKSDWVGRCVEQGRFLVSGPGGRGGSDSGRVVCLGQARSADSRCRWC